MPNPICESCKPTKTAPISQKVECNIQYEFVKKCMDNNKGNVSSCKREWEEFKMCFSSTSKSQMWLLLDWERKWFSPPIDEERSVVAINVGSHEIMLSSEAIQLFNHFCCWTSITFPTQLPPRGESLRYFPPSIDITFHFKHQAFTHLIL